MTAQLGWTPSIPNLANWKKNNWLLCALEDIRRPVLVNLANSGKRILEEKTPLKRVSTFGPILCERTADDPR
jgi:hypothetical protein